VCKNCHTNLTDEQLVYPKLTTKSDSLRFEHIGRYPLVVAELVRLVTTALAAYGYELIEAATHCHPPKDIPTTLRRS
jgi:hypothetical protein